MHGVVMLPSDTESRGVGGAILSVLQNWPGVVGSPIFAVTLCIFNYLH